MKETLALPEITHLQFLVLATLLDDGRPGKKIREELSRRGARRSGPAFYQLMARLEDAGLVEGRYEQRAVDGQVIKERRNRLTPDGRVAWEATRDFYLTQFDVAGAVSPEGA